MFIRKAVRTCLAAVLAAAMASAPAAACTGIMLHAKDGTVVHGRTLEFGTPVETSVAVVPRGQKFTGSTPLGDGMSYTAKYGAVGTITYQNVNVVDGVNEAGLAVGTFYFPSFATYTPATAENRAKGLSPIDFPNWLLVRFATVDEVKDALAKNAAVITPTVIDRWGSEPPPFHYVVYDKTGKSIVVEPIDGRLVVQDNPLGVFTNSPSFDWHMTNLRNYVALDPRNVPPVNIGRETLAPLGQGSGMLGLPGDFTPPSRFVRAAVFSATALPSATSPEAVLQVFHILDNFDIPIGVARETSDGVMHTDSTLLTVARDPQTLRYYYRSYEDQTIRMVDLKQFDLDAKTVKTMSTKGTQPVVDMSTRLK
ncbi:Choloylglycine hydrolase [Rhodovulum sp. PH10]|uniref:linear amide C-N hydrolase n=1 Tax=Rhodovulum sp. PH10 TaxID=1187851 RepID=UPI00027C2E08|nr:choloylglycine hydrolase family protein [Rhodovulum sp. PH10]EJW11034.1 Choloylglycine hydrolase [Rhodovulum sp. PH10]